jgi:hypothetical protein
VRAPSVDPIGVLEPIDPVLVRLGVVGSRIDVKVAEEDVGRVDDDGCPELRLNDRPILDDHI